MTYNFIDKDVWEKFIESRNTPKFLAKSQKVKDNSAKNIYLHRLYCGGYDKLEEIMIKEKRKKKSWDILF